MFHFEVQYIIHSRGTKIFENAEQTRRCKELGFRIDANASILTPSSVFAGDVHTRTAKICSSNVNAALVGILQSSFEKNGKTIHKVIFLEFCLKYIFIPFPELTPFRWKIVDF